MEKTLAVLAITDVFIVEEGLSLCQLLYVIFVP